MYLKKLKILCWNVRGLGDVKKCSVVKNVVRSSRCDVVCFQETKWNKFELDYISTILPSFFQRGGGVWVDACNSTGGILIVWKHSFELLNSFVTRHTCSVVLRQVAMGQVSVITTVYGPSREEDKMNFIEEVRGLGEHINQPWILTGDFNLVRWLVDRSGQMRGLTICFNLMTSLEICN